MNEKFLSNKKIRKLSDKDLSMELERTQVYCDLLIKETKDRLPINKKGLPPHLMPIKFQLKNGNWHNGLFAEELKLFFFGFDFDKDFRSLDDVIDWETLWTKESPLHPSNLIDWDAVKKNPLKRL